MRRQSPKSIKRKIGIVFFRFLMILLMITTLTCPAGAQKAKVNFSDSFGEQYSATSDNLDVPYVPTSMKVVRTLLDLGSVGPGDFLIDLGSGDGRIVITAAKEYGARGFGVDLNKDLVALSQKYAVAEGVEKKADFFVRDIFKTDIRDASVVTMYLLNEVNIQLRPKLLAELKPGSRIISHDFDLGEWRPDKMVHLDIGKSYQDDTILYLWFVPARVAGRWHWNLSSLGENQPFDLELNQSYQNINGVVKNRSYNLQIFDADLKGDRIQFSLFAKVDERMIRQDYKGRVQGNTIVGTVHLKGIVEPALLQWQATRVR
ncbi:SAM-dependent methyltransferase [Thermodesulfobacteriota bacterium]